MRSSDDPPFTVEDRDLLDSLVPAFAAVTRRSTAASGPGNGAPPPPAGVLVPDADLDVRASTAGARAWLAQMVPPSLPFAELAAAAVVFNVASRVLARPTAADEGRHRPPLPARARVRSTTGAWAVIEADALDPLTARSRSRSAPPPPRRSSTCASWPTTSPRVSANSSACFSTEATPAPSATGCFSHHTPCRTT